MALALLPLWVRTRGCASVPALHLCDVLDHYNRLPCTRDHPSLYSADPVGWATTGNGNYFFHRDGQVISESIFVFVLVYL